MTELKGWGDGVGESEFGDPKWFSSPFSYADDKKWCSIFTSPNKLELIQL